MIIALMFSGLLVSIPLVMGLALPHYYDTRDVWKFDGTGHYNLSLPNNRWALVHRSSKYNSSQSHALVLAFHGAGASAQNQEAISNFSNDSLRINGQDIIVVYGQGTQGPKGNIVWQGAPYSSSADDIAYTQNIISAMQSGMNIDSQRIYAVGFSNGGGFVNLLACTASTAPLFGAFATSSPALYSDSRSMSGCDTGGALIAIINFHGLADGPSPYNGRTDLNGNTGYALPNVDAWRQSWAERVGCNASSDDRVLMALSTVSTNYAGQNATSYQWNCPAGTVIGYTVQTMGHFWLTKGGGYWDETPVNMINFFDSHPLGQAT